MLLKYIFTKPKHLEIWLNTAISREGLMVNLFPDEDCAVSNPYKCNVTKYRQAYGFTFCLIAGFYQYFYFLVLLCFSCITKPYLYIFCLSR